MRTRLYSEKKIHFVPLGKYLSSRWLVLNLVCCVSVFFIAKQLHLYQGDNREVREGGLLRGLYLRCQTSLTQMWVIIGWNWENQGTREHFVYDRTLKHSNLKEDWCVKPWKGLALAFTPYISLFFFFFGSSQGVSLWRSSANDFPKQVKARLPFDDRISWNGISQSLISLSSFQSHHCKTSG